MQPSAQPETKNACQLEPDWDGHEIKFHTRSSAGTGHANKLELLFERRKAMQPKENANMIPRAQNGLSIK
jgi:hypothetical protein